MLLSMYALCMAHAQTPAHTGTIFDALTKEPLAGATITNASGQTVLSDVSGHFQIPTKEKITIAFKGYETKTVSPEHHWLIALQPKTEVLQDVVVQSAGRISQKRSEAPVAISVINRQTLEDTKAQRIDQVLNKVSGVFMVNLGNEQHEMSIRQPMTTKSLFLYMEDGIPIRATGVYNHNALLEINLPAAASIEVIKGPSSALYGAEAIAGAVNVITQTAPSVPDGRVSMQANNNGYRRIDLRAGTPLGKKWAVTAGGYYAARNNGIIEYSDYHKAAINIRADYRPGETTMWSNTLAYVDYYSDMTGTLDSVKFAQHNYSTPYTFTYRATNAIRIKSMLKKSWGTRGETIVSAVYRNNSVRQNPSYSIGTTANPLLYRGQINKNAFTSYALFVQHAQQLNWLPAKLAVGGSVEMSPQNYHSNFIWINKDPATGKFSSYYSPRPDSLLQNYHTGIINAAGYLDFSFNPVKYVKLVAAFRYDAFIYDFTNRLDTSKTSVAASNINRYQRVTPKIGFTYNRNGIGLYANYSQGYVPPQLTELYASGSKVAPYLLPQIFSSYETGGWFSLLQNKWYADWSVYLMKGSNEIISVRQPDNTYVNQNAGKTKHTGVEYGITYKPVASLQLRISATHAKHVFVENIVRGVNYNGREMSSAPRCTGNAEVTWKPVFIKGLRLSIEWQHQGNYYMDDLDQYRYPGFDVVNLRAGYSFKRFETWVNILNAGNTYYSTLATKNATTSGNASYAYQPGDPREITIGIGYRFAQ